MTKNVRILREIEFFNINLQKWVKTLGFYPDEWICARPGCIRTTKSHTRQNKSEEHYCSSECRGKHHTKRLHRRRRMHKKIAERC